jgi:N-formylglutamate amidohydrolase
MQVSEKDTDPQVFKIHVPQVSAAPIVLNSPHSGRNYPWEFLASSKLTPHTIRSSEDFMVDELVSGGKLLDLPLLSADFPRAYLDVNREPFELDQNMFSDELPGFVNTKSVRVASGLGTIARIVAEGTEIYAQPLTAQEGLWRVETFYKPYHNALRGLLAKAHITFGCALLLDCHSMPSNNPLQASALRADFVLGDRFGSSCSPGIIHQAKTSLREMGYHVELNKPYAGGFITEHYGRPENGLHALQIEINRGLYMNEVNMTPNPYFDSLRNDLTDLFASLTKLDFTDMHGSQPLAAE